MDELDELKKNIVKTGTSIIGIVCKDGVVMAGDRQVTAGNMVMSKKEQKVVKITDYLVGAWTGMASDAQMLGRIVSAELKLKELRSKIRPNIKEASSLLGLITYRNIRQFSTILSIVGSLVAGVNEDGTVELYTIEPAGGVYKVEDYDANFGSGMPYILGLLERQYKKDMLVKDGINLAMECLKASIQRDIGSGFGIDVWTITKEGIKHVVDQEIVSVFK